MPSLMSSSTSVAGTKKSGLDFATVTHPVLFCPTEDEIPFCFPLLDIRDIVLLLFE
jgi:hypothetical protein